MAKKDIPICACPPGSRAALSADKTLVCSADGKIVPKTCSAKSRRYKVGGGIGVSDDLTRPNVYSYSTPSGVPEIGKAVRKERGCLVEHVKGHAKKDSKDGKVKRGDEVVRKVRLPYRCPPGATQREKTGQCVTADGRAAEPIPDESCGNTSKPCGTGREACPVQLVYRRGQPALRFCPPGRMVINKAGEQKRKGSGMPGWLVPVDSGPNAQKFAAKACAQWEKDGRQFLSTNPAAVAARKARIGYAGTGENKNTLGGGPLAWFR